jgi:hypothetical protein
LTSQAQTKILQMSYQAILALAITLSKEGQLQLILSLSHLGHEETGALRSRCTALINRREPCPHWSGKHYRRYGETRGTQRFKCKDCNRTFTEYTATWLDGIPVFLFIISIRMPYFGCIY